MKLIRRIGYGRLAIGVVVIGVLVAALLGAFDGLPQPEQVIEDVAKALGPWTYLLVGGLAFLETGAFVGLVAPGEFAIMIGGVVAAQGEIEIIPLIGIVWFAAVAGDSLSFYIGHRLGRAFLEKHGPRVKITPERLDKVEGYFQKYGGRTILIGRFIGLVRALAPFIAGSSKMSYRRFIPYSIVGTGLWATTFCLLGYIFYRSFEKVAGYAGKATFVFGCVVVTVVAGVWAYRQLREPENRLKAMEWLDSHRVTRPVAGLIRRAERPARFVRDRLTPGGLGLEFTTAMAVGGVGLYAFTLYAVILSGDTTFTPADEAFLDLAEKLRSVVAVDIVKVATDLGSLPVTGFCALAAGAVLLWRGSVAEAVTLVLSFVLIYVAVHVAKEAIDRPRPAGGVIDVEGASYPSGHAAYATVYVWIALFVARAWRGVIKRAAVVSVAFGITVFVGLSRIYLGVHYWSDVAGGWGLGFGILGSCSAVALLVVFLRNNAPDAPARSRT